jgi:uncharacterized membrane protein
MATMSESTRRVTPSSLLYEKLRWAALVMAALGLLDSVYLAWAKLTPGSVVCSDSGACDAVQNSPYSEIGGIPIALIGAGSYALIMLLLVFERKFEGDLPLLAVFGLGLVGVIYSGYLTYLELAVIHAICPYCVASAILISGVFLVSIARLAMVED